MTEDITYYSNFFTKGFTDEFFNILKDNISWTDTVTTSSGEQVKLHRKMAYIADVQKEYFYNTLKFETPNGTWADDSISSKCLKTIKNIVEKQIDNKFNSVLLNYYKDGKDEIKWHSDNEFCLGEHPVIACINLGASRKFWMQEKKSNGERFYITLNDGDLLVMNAHCQENWLHAILKEKEITESRISLTFRRCE